MKTSPPEHLLDSDSTLLQSTVPNSGQARKIIGTQRTAGNSSASRFKLPPGVAGGWLAVCLLGLLFGLAGASLAPELSYQEFQQIKREIAELPQDERARIERNHEAYRKMSAEQRERFWEMHRFVEKQRLQPLVKAYAQWLESLSTFERQSLRNVSDPGEKIAKVEAILREQRQRHEQRLPELIGRTIEQGESGVSSWALRLLLRQQDRVDFSEPYALSKEQLDLIIDEALLPQLNSASQQKLSQLQGLEKVVQVLRASMEAMNNPQDSWPNNETFELLAQLGLELTGGPQPTEARSGSYPEWFTPDFWRRIALRRLLVRSLLIYEMQELERKYPVKENDLLNYFSKLETPTQATLLDSPAEYQTEALKWLYLWNQHRKNSVFEDPDFREHVLNKMTPRGFGDRYPPGSRPGRESTRDGRGRPPEGPNGPGGQRGPGGQGGPNGRGGPGGPNGRGPGGPPD